MGSSIQDVSEKDDASVLLSRNSVLSVLAVLALFLAHPSTGAALSWGQDSVPVAAGALEETPARGKFLIASRELVEPTFARRVVVLLDHDERRGGIGLIINRPTGVPLTRVVRGLEGIEGADEPVRSGGPVERNRLFMLMRADARPPGTERILEDTFGSSTLDPLRALLASGRAESVEFIVYAGYAGWAPGQLEAEIERGDWHVAPGRSEHLFDTDAAEVWPRLIRLHGGKWVEGPRPASGPTDAMSLLRAVREPRAAALQGGVAPRGARDPAAAAPASAAPAMHRPQGKVVPSGVGAFDEPLVVGTGNHAPVPVPGPGFASARRVVQPVPNLRAIPASCAKRNCNEREG